MTGEKLQYKRTRVRIMNVTKSAGVRVLKISTSTPAAALIVRVTMFPSPAAGGWALTCSTSCNRGTCSCPDEIRTCRRFEVP